MSDDISRAYPDAMHEAVKLLMRTPLGKQLLEFAEINGLVMHHSGTLSKRPGRVAVILGKNIVDQICEKEFNAQMSLVMRRRWSHHFVLPRCAEEKMRGAVFIGTNTIEETRLLSWKGHNPLHAIPHSKEGDDYRWELSISEAIAETAYERGHYRWKARAADADFQLRKEIQDVLGEMYKETMGLDSMSPERIGKGIHRSESPHSSSYAPQ